VLKHPRKAFGYLRKALTLLNKIGGRYRMTFLFDAFQIFAGYTNHDLVKE
jgi:hypothetical protein